MVVQRISAQKKKHRDSAPAASPNPTTIHSCKLLEGSSLKSRGCCVQKHWLQTSRPHAPQVQSRSWLHLIVDCKTDSRSAPNSCSSSTPCGTCCVRPATTGDSQTHCILYSPVMLLVMSHGYRLMQTQGGALDQACVQNERDALSGC